MAYHITITPDLRASVNLRLKTTTLKVPLMLIPAIEALAHAWYGSIIDEKERELVRRVKHKAALNRAAQARYRIKHKGKK